LRPAAGTTPAPKASHEPLNGLNASALDRNSTLALYRDEDLVDGWDEFTEQAT
jgi:hypothetical protein